MHICRIPNQTRTQDFCYHFVMRVHAGLCHRRQQTADPRGPAPCGPADHRQRGHIPEEQRGTAAVPWTSLTSQWISPTHVGRPRKALQSSIESFVVSSFLSNVPAGLWSVISLIWVPFTGLQTPHKLLVTVGFCWFDQSLHTKPEGRAASS